MSVQQTVIIHRDTWSTGKVLQLSKIKARLIALQVGLILSFCAHTQNTGNPILSDYTADPDILIANNKYYVYTTAFGDNNTQFHAFSSTNLSNWTDEGVVFDLTSTTWANQQGYAPSVVFRNNKYYFYFSGNEKVGVAVGNSPVGPFSDPLGAPIVTDNFNGPNIDQGVFIDDDGQAYLYYGQNTFRIVKLNADMTSTNGSINISTPSGYFEAPYLFKRNSIYYLMFSVSQFTSDDYHVEYATSSSPLGPWTKKGRLTAPTSFCKGPGHNAVFKFPGCDEWYILYHGHTGDLNRRTRIDRLYFATDGTIPSIYLTTTGVPVHALTNSACFIASTYPAAGKVYTLTPKHDQDNRLHESGNVPSGDARSLSADNSNRQRWKLIADEGGYYQLEPESDAGKRLDVTGAGTTAGTEVGVWNENGNDAQKWRLIDAGDGWFQLEPKNAPGMRLDVAGAGTGSDVNVYLWTENGNDAQKWRFTEVGAPAAGKVYTLTPKHDQDNRLHESGNVPSGDARSLSADNSIRQQWKLIDDGGGYYKLEPQSDPGKRLDVSGAGTTAGTEVAIWNENGNDAQRWKLINDGTGWFQLEPKNAPGMRLDVAGAGTGSDVNVYLWTENGNDAQKWRFTEVSTVIPIAGNIYQLQPKHDLDNRLHESGNVPSGDARSVTVDNSNRQQWKLIDAGGGYYQFEPQSDIGKRLDVSGAGTTAGTDVAVWYDNDNDAQKWKLIDVGDGWFELEPKNAPGLRLDVSGGGTGADVNVALWTQNGFDAQKWKFLTSSGSSLRRASTESPAMVRNDTLQRFMLSPNPAKTAVTLRFTTIQSGHASMNIYTSSGALVRKVFDGKLEKNQTFSKQIDVSGLPSGVYGILLTGTQGSIYRQLVITK